MIINEVEYYVGLYAMDTEGFPKDEMYFEDFYALNAFIRENVENPKYRNEKMAYSIIENINGEPDSLSWIKDIEWSELSEEQIQTEIDNFIEDERENKEYWTKVDEFSKEIHYFNDGEDYPKKQYRLNDFAYVCPHCIREVNDCQCASYPYYLVQIDKMMVPIIRELNSKGYETKGCCAGHIENNAFSQPYIYIAFAENYNFDEPFPDGGEYSLSSHTLRYQLPEKCEDPAAFQRDILYRLEDWAEMLFERDCDWDLSEADKEECEGE